MQSVTAPIILSSLGNQLFVAFQRALPAALLGRLFYRASRWRTRWFKNLLIRGFAWLYGVDVEEAAEPVPDGYAHLNSFFTRRLKPGSRPFDDDPAAVCSPADGTIQQIGRIREDEILQAKRMDYRVAALLGNADDAAAYRNGLFATVYLAPHDYHRVHAPLDGTLQSMVYVPGARLAVNRRTAETVPSLFAGNERLALHFRGPAGPHCVVLVGAMNVSCISTAWQSEVIPREPREIRRWCFDGTDGEPRRFAKGDDLARFELGSTVILLLPAGAVTWRQALAAGEHLRTGVRLGTLSAG